MRFGLKGGVLCRLSTEAFRMQKFGGIPTAKGPKHSNLRYIWFLLTLRIITTILGTYSVFGC